MKLIRYKLAKKSMTTDTEVLSKIFPIITDENPPTARPTFKITLLAIE